MNQVPSCAVRIGAGRGWFSWFAAFCFAASLAIPAAAQSCDYTVSSLADSGTGTLRAGLADPNVTNICINLQGTITLATPLQIVFPVTITGSVSLTISGNNQVGIFVINESSTTDAVRLNGLTLSNGNAAQGGAIWIQQGNVVLVGTVITNNTAQSGGAIYNQGTLTLSQCGISSNTSTGLGLSAAIDNQSNAVLTISGASISNNSSTNGAGGVYNNGNTQVTGGYFTGNTGHLGGAIYNDFYSQGLNISGGTLFSNNVATPSGAAVYNAGSNLRVMQALFTENAAQNSSPSLISCGGAVCNTGSATISESTFTLNNSTQNGGAIGNIGNGVLTLVNDTIYANTAGGAGNGVDNEASITASNSIISGSSTGNCNNCSAITGSNLIDVDPSLGPLALNGGPTMTMMPLPGGASVGTGDPTKTVDDFDERGLSRLSSNEGVDIGAVQSHYSSVSYLTQPANTYVDQVIAPAVAVQVVETDGETTNYPQGVPVTIQLVNPEGGSATLSGTLTQQPTSSGGVTSAVFPDLSVNASGTYQLFATDAISGNSSSADPVYNATSNAFQVSQPVVTLSWQPAIITYGPMPASEFNAVATVNGSPATGSFVYTFVASGETINVGQIYPVGTYRVQVVFTPTGSTDHYMLGTSLQINQATPVITWPTPAAIYTSTPLGSAQLDANATGVTGAALPGTFVYTPAAGATLSAGSQYLAVAFTPTDTADYTSASARVTIQVNAVTAASVAVQESANPITFGQSDTLTAVVTGTDGKPFSGGTAAFSSDSTVIGSAPVVNGSAAITAESLTGGTHQIGVTYTNTATNQTLTSSTGLTVNKATPMLTWPTPAAIYTSTPLGSAQLNASATGVTGAALAGSFAYNPAAGTTLTAGSHVLSTTFTPTDTTDYNTNTAQVSIQVNAPTANGVVIQESANPVTFGQSETLTAVVTGSDGKPYSGGTASFTSDSTAIGSAPVVNGSAAVTIASLTGGTHQIGVTYTNTATSQTLTGGASLTVSKATPVLTWATPAPIYTSTPLSAMQLNAKAAGVTGTTLAGTFVYSPAAGATLTAGAHVLSTTFTPTDAADYNTSTAQVTIQVNAPAANTVVIQESANPIAFGQKETLTAVVTGSDGNPYSGGTCSFTADGNVIGSATVANGLASVTTSSLHAGSHQIAVSYTNPSLELPLTGSAGLTVSKATPQIAWPTPASIYTITPLGSSQLNATATGVNNSALPGAFVYSPAAGTTLSAGSHVLSAAFTPTDTADYTTATAQVSIQVTYSPISIASVSPSTTPLSTSPLLVVVSGTGFTATTVVELNGSALATSVQSPTALTATIPAASLATAGTLKLSVYDAASKATSNTVQLTVTAPSANVSLSLSSGSGSGDQPAVGISLNSPYPSDLTGTLTLAFAPTDNGIDDPAIQFSTGGRALTFTVPAGSTTTPQVALQTGTVAGTITVTLALAAGGVDVTPAGLAPLTLVIAPAAPVITNVSFANTSDGLITVVVSGFSNTRDMTQAEFVFTGGDADSLKSSKVDIPVTGLFTPWYSSADSDQYGSEFTYTQNFQLSKPDPGITGVSATLTNSVGISGSVNSQ